MELPQVDHQESLPDGGPAPDTLAEAAALRDRRFRDLTAAVTAHGAHLPSKVRDSLLVGGAAPKGLAEFVAKVAWAGSR